MSQLPKIVEKPSSPLVRATAYLLAPVLLVLALPLLLLLVLLLYLAALFHGARVFVYVWTGKPEPPSEEPRGPHFLEQQKPANTLPFEIPSTGEEEQ